MVWGVVQNFRASLKYRGGWKGLIDHMYTVSESNAITVGDDDLSQALTSASPTPNFFASPSFHTHDTSTK